MAVPNDVKEVLHKIFKAINDDPEKLNPEKLINLSPEYAGRRDERRYTVENLEALSSNHLFDDHPKLYGITELEGGTLRHYFSVGAETYDFIKDLRKEFPDFFKCSESQDYLESADSRRRNRGLDPLLL